MRSFSCAVTFTTKHTKGTKFGKEDSFIFLFFVIFVPFVVKIVTRFWLRLCRAGSFVTFVVQFPLRGTLCYKPGR